VQRSAVTVVIALIFVFASAAPSWAAKKRHSSSRLSHEATIEQLLNLHNARRATDGAPALTINAKLQSAAQDYAEYLAKSGKFSHTADGSPGSRVKQAGYKYHAVGENIAKGQSTPSAVVSGWMHSDGHRKNILNKHYREVGFGVAKDKKGRTVWVTDFGHK